ncbi:MAG TPA: hypothetical protein VL547_03300 [Dinghuibacter sp.]|jgi:hypothetical protein|uniref:hypothetical protein n=1 Tax=Dinghuibacter sp. TaxID=2024697 RepID=UPI002BEB4F7C|nr:hypothetical protein [Dinghuibacter sp.]HTJ11017.1 hypothetical protein [Dinghuibacter sp.]
MTPLTNRNIADILSDLIQINADRISWYEKWIPSLPPEDKDLGAAFESNLRKSRDLNVFLFEELDDLGMTRAADTGPLYRAWIKAGGQYNSHNRHAVLMNCESAEWAVEEIYHHLLDDPLMPGYLKELLGEQVMEREKMRRRITALKTTAL